MSQQEMQAAIYSTLSSIADTYHLEIPDDNTQLPCILYYFLSEVAGFEADDTSYDAEYTLHIDLFIPAYDIALKEQVKEQIMDLPYNNSFLSINTTAADGAIHVAYEFEIYN